jgi:dienelactone hydrolase
MPSSVAFDAPETVVATMPTRAAAGRHPGMTVVFACAAGLAALHWLDAAFVDGWAGQGARRGLPAAIGAVLFAAAARLVWPRVARGPRALVAFVTGLIVLAAGVLSVTAVAAGDSEGGAWSGLLLLPAGLAMLGCAVASLRGAPHRRPLERWVRRAIGVLAALLSLMWIVMPVGVALFATGKPRAGVPAGALGIAHENVTFRSTDGLRLAGWYVPSRNGAAIVLVHGGGGSRAGAVVHARMLARHGYGVLLYDERGRGESQGAPDAIGWTWQRDVAGALAWLERQPDVASGKIGGLGLSTGAEALVQAAAERRDLHAVIADGAEARSATEAGRVATASDRPYWSSLYLANRVLTATAPPPDLGELVTHLHAPVLLIAAGRDQEARFGRIYAQRSRGRARLWQVADATHTHALRVHRSEYERRVIGFLDATLHPRARGVTG